MLNFCQTGFYVNWKINDVYCFKWVMGTLPDKAQLNLLQCNKLSQAVYKLNENNVNQANGVTLYEGDEVWVLCVFLVVLARRGGHDVIK